MGKFKKGNKIGFTKGNTPRNKLTSPVNKLASLRKIPERQSKTANGISNQSKEVGRSKLIQNTGTSRGLRLRGTLKKSESDDVKPKYITRQNRLSATWQRESKSCRIINIQHNADMWNKTHREHQNMSPACTGFLHWDMNAEQIRGLGCREQMICNKCSYRSKMFNLYEEIPSTKRGRRAAKQNVGAVVGLSKSPIAAASLINICLSANIPAPSAKSLQNTTNKVMPVIEKINKNDMNLRRAKLIEQQEADGKTNPNVIYVQSDGMYNNSLYSGVGKTPFQPATQVIYSIAKNVTPSHEIIGLVVHNKLCSKGKHLKPSPHHKCIGEDCSATIPFQKSIGDEKSWAKEGLEDLKKSNNLEIEYITTDPDSSAYLAAQELHKQNVTETQPIHQIDTRHLSANHRKFVKNHKRLSDIMQGKTVKIRTRNQNNFAIYLAERCHGELKTAFRLYSGNAAKMKNKLSHSVDAIVKCYQGSHHECIKNSFACKGRKKNNWLVKKQTLLGRDFALKSTETTSEILRECINYRLGPTVLDKTILNSNTQKVEAFNRALRSSLPKNVTYSRNVSGRAHSVAHSVNVGKGNSILDLCQKLGCPISVHSKVGKALKEMQKHEDLLKSYKKMLKSKLSRAEVKVLLYKLYEKYQEQISYKKNVLFPSTSKSSVDHTYSKFSKLKIVKSRK